MDRKVLRLFVFVLMAFGLSSPLLAAPTAAPSSRHKTFAMNNLTFALYHEIGHLLISEFNLPVLGKEEDAADNIATMLLLAKQADDANQALIDSARGWKSWSLMSPTLDSVANNKQLQVSNLAGAHSLDRLRAGQLGCLMMGSRREIFANVALELGLSGATDELETCTRNLGQIIASWLRIKSSFVQSGSSEYPINIVYETVPGFKAMTELMRSNRFLEGVAQSVLSHYDLPRAVTLRATSCGTNNAYFDPATGEILICYELGDFYLEMARNLPQ